MVSDMAFEWVPDAPGIIDTQVYISRWPCRRLPYDDTARLVAHLQKHGITQAWAGSFDALLHRDVAGVNLRTVQECRQFGQEVLQPVGCVNPALPDWQEDMRRCAEDHQMRVVRLHPGYHGYDLADARVPELLDLAIRHKLIVQLAVRMEDPRTQHPLLQVADVDLTPLPPLLSTRPELPVILLNGLQAVSGTIRTALIALPNVCVEIATQEGVGGVAKLIREFPFQRVLFGSYFPFFVLQAAMLKLQESDPGAEIRRAITHDNATRLLNTWTRIRGR